MRDETHNKTHDRSDNHDEAMMNICGTAWRQPPSGYLLKWRGEGWYAPTWEADSNDVTLELADAQNPNSRKYATLEECLNENFGYSWDIERVIFVSEEAAR